MTEIKPQVLPPDPRRVVDINYVKACFERWARGEFGVSAGRETSITGRLMMGVRANICPGWLDDVQARRAHDPHCQLCGGKGKLRLDLSANKRTRVIACKVCDDKGKFQGEWCWRCNGTKRIEIQDLRVNPAGIRSTRHDGGAATIDPVVQALRQLISTWFKSDWTIWLGKVAVEEYCWSGRQEEKAGRLRISRSFYHKNLREVHFRAERVLIQLSL